ncbi:hypothetical protein LTR36_006757 [Oleoguttula mirabilis]|uniref:DUF7728 domain-containing protein n=1 Tax=Oleoguttula mirabilis TaxID=1507867 RepID=A0AAV9JC09_9PEZI|nr:hypothetical protein LTR36_006757 [Oleoguttula mirabilis]
MLGRSVGIAAACVLGARAFIIPSGIAPASNGDAPDLSITTVNSPKSQVITLPCSECAFSTTQEKIEDVDEDEEAFWIQGGANSLVLNFTVSEDGQRLQLNGGDIYPPRFQQDGWFEQQPIYVKQVPSQAGMVDIKSGAVQSTDLELTAYGWEEPKKEALSPNGDMLVSARFTIMGLENEYVSVDDVAFKLLETGDGELLIMEVERMEVENSPHGRPVFDDESFPPPGPDDMPEDMDFPPHHGPPHHGPPPHGPPPHGPPPHGPPPHGPPHHHKDQHCNMLPEPLCKLKAMIESKIDQAMTSRPGPPRQKGGCNGRKGPHGMDLPGHIKPHFNRPGQEDRPHHEAGPDEMDRPDYEAGPDAMDRPDHEAGPDEMDRPDQEDRPKYHHGRPHHMRPHGEHHGHHRHHHFFGHHFLHSFAKGLVAVLIPVMAGITVGMTVSLLGLVVGRLIGFVWIKFARGGRRGYASVAQQELVAEEGENKDVIAVMEAPPVYEDSPAYVISEKE